MSRSVWMQSSALLACGLGLTGWAVEGLRTSYERSKDVRVETHTSISIETTAMETTVDGEVRENRGGMPSQDERREVVLIDRVLAQTDGKPTKVRRTFETLNGKTEATFGDQTREFETESELEGLVVEFTSEGDEVKAEVIKGSAPSDETALQGHALGLALDAFLPPAEVDGKAWALDKDDVLAGLSLQLSNAYFPRPAPEGGEGAEAGRPRGGGGRGNRGTGFLAQADWTGQAKLGEETTHEGEACAVIELEMQAKGELEDRGFGARRGGDAFLVSTSAALATVYEVELEGRLLYSKAKRMPVRLELKGKLEIETNMERETDRGSFKLHSRQEGELEMTVSATEVEREDA